MDRKVDYGALPLVGYVRVSTVDQAEGGASLTAQRQTIQGACQRAGRPLLTIIEEQASGKSVKDRPGLRRALGLIRRRRAGGLVAAKLDRLSRSMLDFAVLLEGSVREGWLVVVCDLAMDTATPEGEALAYVLMAWAQFERRRIAQRTREALAVKRAQGVRLGRPSGLTAPVRTRILRAWRTGAGWSQIAAALNMEGVPTAHGAAVWHPATIRYICLRR